jgi:hypothetical protein
MAPLTLTEKYDDLVRCADQPVSSYDKLTNEDLEDVISKIWPFIIESITYTRLSSENNDSIMASFLINGEVRTELERRLKIQFQLYSEAAKRCQQRFPNRQPIRRNRDRAFKKTVFETDICSLFVQIQILIGQILDHCLLIHLRHFLLTTDQK